MSEREEWINLIRNEYDPRPNLGKADYPGFEWDDGAGRIADAIMAEIQRYRVGVRPSRGGERVECPSCKQMFENGAQCAAPVMRGGCPMGGDV